MINKKSKKGKSKSISQVDKGKKGKTKELKANIKPKANTKAKANIKPKTNTKSNTKAKVNTKSKTKKKIRELLNDKPDDIYIDKDKGRDLKILDIYGNYLIEYNGARYFCEVDNRDNIIDENNIDFNFPVNEKKLFNKYGINFSRGYIDKESIYISINLNLKNIDNDILNEYLNKSTKDKYFKDKDDKIKSNNLKKIKKIIKGNPELIEKCKLFDDNDNKSLYSSNKNKCVMMELNIFNNNYYHFNIFDFLYGNIKKYCNNLPGSIWLYIIENIIHNYKNSKYKYKICDIQDEANKKEFTFCFGLNKLYKNKKLNIDDFIKILSKTIYKYDIFPLSSRMIINNGIGFYEKYGYVSINHIVYGFKNRNNLNYYNSLINYMELIKFRNILINTDILQINKIITFIIKYKDKLNKDNLNNNNPSKVKDKDDNNKLLFCKTLNDNEIYLFNFIMDIDNYDLDILNKILTNNKLLFGFIEYFKMYNKTFMNEYLESHELITIKHIYNFILYLIDNIDKLFSNKSKLTYNDFNKFKMIIHKFCSKVDYSLNISTYIFDYQHVKIYNTCKYFIDMENGKYENFDKYVAITHQKIRGINPEYIRPNNFTTPPIKELKELIKKNEVIILTQKQFNNKINELNNELLDLYKLNESLDNKTQLSFKNI